MRYNLRNQPCSRMNTDILSPRRIDPVPVSVGTGTPVVSKRVSRPPVVETPSLLLSTKTTQKTPEPKIQSGSPTP